VTPDLTIPLVSGGITGAGVILACAAGVLGAYGLTRAVRSIDHTPGSASDDRAYRLMSIGFGALSTASAAAALGGPVDLAWAFPVGAGLGALATWIVARAKAAARARIKRMQETRPDDL